MKTFGWTRPLRDASGEVIGSKPSPVKVRTIGTLSAAYGTDRNKRLVFTMEKHDLIAVRPERTGRELMIEAFDLYALLIRRQANVAHLEKARERKAKKASRLARLRQERAERRLTREARAEH